ncbi:biosynthetic-type acetolactate synthase large subunit [Bacillus sp. B15-48]|uniref:biosynthetic-type acetolactate synthase large subunit n=1 Tax=Bacillus sp. B15-48 TaxID=1548601 RepID=UPI00193FBC0F|nr:biosynthetic-type acetolactate synthase large subunit [Bacillus sp. B15-48]MBM4763417.1 biosynthetic-type acetolactate synthase large subunit [Bacillus sp. B15-48]
MIATQTKTFEFTGTELLIDSILAEKTEVVFGSISGSMQNLYDPFDKCKQLKQVILEHEQATIHAADGYARATGKTGVAYIPPGSAMTNAITGVLTAQIDSVPLVIITLHEENLDLFGLTTPVTKYYLRIDDISEIQQTLSEAFSIANEGRPGAVVVEMATDVLIKQTNATAPKVMKQHREIEESPLPIKTIERVKAEILAAKKPVLFIGGGVISANASMLVRELVDRTKIPVVSTLMGLGAFPANHPLFLGMLGMHGTFAANKSVHRADLLICLGVRFSDRVTGKLNGFSPKSRKIQIDIDAAEINKNINIDLPIVGDVYTVLSQLLDQEIPSDTTEWIKETSSWQKIAPRFSDSKSELKPQQVIQLVDEYSSEKAIVATDVGQHQIWTAHNYKFNHPRTFVTSGGLGTMGFGLPAAIGAALATDNNEVILVSGDGSFQMNYQELATVAKYQLPIKIVILKNGYLGMVRQWQEMFYKGRYSSVKISSPDFITLAKAYGLETGRAANLLEAKTAIQQAFSHHHPTVIEFDVTEEENVFPIVPPGKNNTDTILN